MFLLGMHFWDEAAQRLARKGTKAAPNPLRRFGFITTNSITQAFSRRVVEKALGAKQPISLVFAVADHPWLKATDKAAVRIAMTVAERGEHKGVLAKVKTEAGLDSDTPKVELAKEEGKLTAKLTLGAPVFQSKPLLANSLIAAFGMALHEFVSIYIYGILLYGPTILDHSSLSTILFQGENHEWLRRC